MKTPDDDIHDSYRALLAAYAAGVLSASTSHEMEEHVAECEWCRAELGQWQQIRAVALAETKSYAEPVPAFEKAWSQLKRQLSTQQRQTDTRLDSMRSLTFYEVELEDLDSSGDNHRGAGSLPAVVAVQPASRRAARISRAINAVLAFAAVLLLAVGALIAFGHSNVIGGANHGSSQAARATHAPSVTSTATASVIPTGVPPSPTGSPVGWTYYHDATYHFVLDVPASWSIFTSNGGYYLFQDQGSAANGDYAMLDVSVTDIPNRITPEEQEFCTSAKTTTIAGFPAVVADHNPPVGVASGGAQLERLFVANGLFYIIQLTSPQGLDLLQQRLGQLFAQILASFQPGPGKPGNVICPS
jgi:anti-sigma factor RsiW